MRVSEVMIQAFKAQKLKLLQSFFVFSDITKRLEINMVTLSHGVFCSVLQCVLITSPASIEKLLPHSTNIKKTIHNPYWCPHSFYRTYNVQFNISQLNLKFLGHVTRRYINFSILALTSQTKEIVKKKNLKSEHLILTSESNMLFTCLKNKKK